MNSLATQGHVSVVLGPPRFEEISEDEGDRSSIAPSETGQSATDTARSVNQAMLPYVRESHLPSTDEDSDLSSTDEDFFSCDESHDSASSSQRRRVYRHRSSHSERGERRGEKPEVKIWLASGGMTREISEKKKKTMEKVNRCFAKVKEGVFTALVYRGDIAQADKDKFKLVIDSKRQIMHWHIDGEDRKGVYDFHNDKELSTEAKEEIASNARQMVLLTEKATGITAGSIQRVVPGCVGSLGKTNLSSYFMSIDHDKFGGRIKGEGTEKEKRTRAFRDFMQKDFEHALKSGHARDTKEVAKDAVSAFALNHTVIETLTKLEKKYDEAFKEASEDAAGRSDTRVEALKKKLLEVRQLLSQFKTQHMNPFLVAKSYTTPTEPNKFKVANQLETMYRAHYEGLAEEQQDTWSKATNRLRGRKFDPPKSYQVLAKRMAGVEAFNSGGEVDRSSYVQYSRMSRFGNNNSSGLEEAFYKNLMDQFNDRLSGGYAKELPPMFADCAEETQEALKIALFGKKAVQRTDESEGSPEIKGALEKISRFRMLVDRNLRIDEETTTEEIVDKLTRLRSYEQLFA